MAKKTKSSQQRSKEEQWRRRMAAQARSVPASGRPAAVQDRSDGRGTVSAGTATLDEAVEEEPTPLPRVSPRESRPAAYSAAAQRRAPATQRGPRARLATPPLSIEEEMHYVRSDIRRLVILTSLCIAVLIALSFVIR